MHKYYRVTNNLKNVAMASKRSFTPRLTKIIIIHATNPGILQAQQVNEPIQENDS